MRRTQIALVLVGLAALALGGTAIAAMKLNSNGSRATAAARDQRQGRGDDFSAASSYLGLTTQQLLDQLRGGKTMALIADSTPGKSRAGLVAALVAHEKQELADAVSSGRLSQAQSDQIASGLQQRFESFVDGARPLRPPWLPARPHCDGIHVAATYLGISDDALIAQLRAGKTLAQIANATSGKSAAGLVDALVADATARFGANAPSDLRRRITDLVNGTLPALGPRGRHDYWGPHPRGGTI
jgi:hypothetical protein